MPFNSNTYQGRKWDQIARDHLAEARCLKARIDEGGGSDHDRRMLPLLAKGAVAFARVARMHRRRRVEGAGR